MDSNKTIYIHELINWIDIQNLEDSKDLTNIKQIILTIYNDIRGKMINDIYKYLNDGYEIIVIQKDGSYILGSFRMKEACRIDS